MIYFLSSDVFQQVEMPAQYCLALLELNGIGFSVAECEAQKHVMQAKLHDLENKAYQLAGHSFSLTSPEDVAEVCFNLGKLYEMLFVVQNALSFVWNYHGIVERNCVSPPLEQFCCVISRSCSLNWSYLQMVI